MLYAQPGGPECSVPLPSFVTIPDNRQVQESGAENAGGPSTQVAPRPPDDLQLETTQDDEGDESGLMHTTMQLESTTTKWGIQMKDRDSHLAVFQDVAAAAPHYLGRVPHWRTVSYCLHAGCSQEGEAESVGGHVRQPQPAIHRSAIPCWGHE